MHNAEHSPTNPRYGERRISDKEYDELRKHTPSRKIRQKVNENNVIGADAPAIPGKKIEGSLEADHIVSMDKIASNAKVKATLKKKLISNIKKTAIFKR